jgi:hypothetical protein
VLGRKCAGRLLKLRSRVVVESGQLEAAPKDQEECGVRRSAPSYSRLRLASKVPLVNRLGWYYGRTKIGAVGDKFISSGRGDLDCDKEKKMLRRAS